ncbi:MAG: long-chain fatty acid--CoA ligase [Phaeodactylibacter sp.]|nr:long-chain fatty acid--CoA ligase [Phaeodactylibacter sp.]MCB9292864.1 long-chain fatty acid--CoA ligase [Lewinellaceae bacterium]
MRQPQQDWIAKWALYSPNKIAVKEFESGNTYTYGELHRLGNRLAFHLQGRYGIQKGSRIAILAENCLEYIALFAAAQKLGCILVPVNYRLASAEVDYLLRDSGPSLAICEKKFAPLLQGAPTFASIPHFWSLEELSAFCQKEKEGNHGEPFPLQPVEEDDPVFILYTSGTTGFPKGAIYSHKMLFWNSINTAISLILNTESRTVNVMPPFHTGGWNVLTTPFLHHGAYTCMTKKFDASTVLRLLQEEDVTLFMGVPTMLRMMAEVPEFEEATFPSLYYIIVGGEPMPIPLIERWQLAKGVAIRQGYGMTEVGPNLTSLHQNDAIRKKGSIGRPNFYVDIRIVDSQGQEVAENTAGELLLRGPMVTPGYWRNEEATRKAIVDGWFHTGDMVRLDEEGYLFVVDRIKNMFISGGENVYPAEVERVLQSHGGVSEAAVVGVPDAKWGEVGKAFVVRRPGVQLSETDLREHCRNLLARFKVPRYIIFVEELPKNDTGKINRAALKQLA